MSKKINPEALQISTQKGFQNEFFDNLKHYPTRLAAFEAAQNKYKEYFGKLRYSNYDSFRKSINNKTN